MRKLKVLAVILMLVMLVSIFVGISQAEEKIKVAFIYGGPHNDGGYTQAHDEGRIYLEKKLPYVETTYSENVTEGAPAEKVIRDYCNQGYKVIFGPSFGFMDPMLNVAKDFPDVVFEHCAGFKTAENMGNYFGRIYQPFYLAGLVAGMMTKSNYIGFVAPFSIPQIVRQIDSFTIGVREVNPKAEVYVIWLNIWLDPVKEADAAKIFIANGADIVAISMNTPASMQVAEKAGKYGISYGIDNAASAPKAVLTSPIWNWGAYYEQVLKAVHDGTWKPEEFWGGMETGVVKLAPYGPMVPEDVRKYVDKRKQEIIEGKFEVFTGPLYDQNGKLMVKEGEELSDGDKLSIQWFVKGVVGTIPK